MSSDKWYQVYKAINALEAHCVKGMLESEGVDVQLRGEGLSAAAGELPMEVVEVTLWVDSAQYVQAQNLISNYEKTDYPQWYCHQCGELNEGQFELCWQCGQVHDSTNNS
ncbi:DUF2007 domain-containing protein [Photobacterium makurazakiensis]|uniref:putative signal transducing protein n=1 Tax=Photobacterium makurazakiensis TaxID=2910234 RepID=UPI003D13DDBF